MKSELIDNEEVAKMFVEADVSFDDMHGYLKSKYTPDDDLYERDQVVLLIERIKEWKNGRVL